MPKYFVDEAGVCHGECYAEEPENPDGYRIIPSDEPLEGDPFKFVYRDGAFHWADDADEKLASEVRAFRNSLIKDTDWSQGKDIPDSVSSKWAEYRQALRDVSKQAGFPRKVEWPEAPK